MKGLSSILLCLLVVGGSAFTTKKPKQKQHPVFTATHTAAAEAESTPKATAFVASAVQDHYEIAEEPMVSPGTAALACLLTMAVGFGLGYGT